MQNWILQQRVKADQAAVAEAQRVQREIEEGEVVLSPRILDPGVELAILDPGLLWSRPSSLQVAVQVVGRDEDQGRCELNVVSESEGSSIAESEYDEAAVLLEAETAVSARASPVFVRRAGTVGGLV